MHINTCIDSHNICIFIYCAREKSTCVCLMFLLVCCYCLLFYFECANVWERIGSFDFPIHRCTLFKHKRLQYSLVICAHKLTNTHSLAYTILYVCQYVYMKNSSWQYTWNIQMLDTHFKSHILNTYRTSKHVHRSHIYIYIQEKRTHWHEWYVQTYICNKNNKKAEEKMAIWNESNRAWCSVGIQPL